MREVLRIAADLVRKRTGGCGAGGVISQNRDQVAHGNKSGLFGAVVTYESKMKFLVGLVWIIGFIEEFVKIGFFDLGIERLKKESWDIFGADCFRYGRLRATVIHCVVISGLSHDQRFVVIHGS